MTRFVLSFLFILIAYPAFAVEIRLPLGRKAYQTNESIDVAVIRSRPVALASGELQLTLAGFGHHRIQATFPVPAVALVGKEARRTEFLSLNARLLRPGYYTLLVTVDGENAAVPIEVYSHVRRSNFRLVDWGSRAKDTEQTVLGEDGMGFNVFYASYGGLDTDAVIRAGMDYMWCCTMGGGHQMDLRLECDWSDPAVLRGGCARVVRRAFIDRTRPNAIGVHFYDEPGLTWHKHPATGEFTPHGVPAQERAYRAIFGGDAPVYSQIKGNNPADVERWMHWGRWKMSILEAAWRDAAFGVSQVRSDFFSTNQADYGWSAFTDGYYYNVARSLPIRNGHGGYDDYGGLYFNPSFTFEFGRARDLARPVWYLPAWYDGTPSNRFRMEQYLSFMTNLQGMMKPPDMQVHRPSRSVTAAGIVESNQQMARLGTIFTTMPVTRPAVAVLYSLSHNLRAQTRDLQDNYDGAGHARTKTLLAYLAGKRAHLPLFPVVEEDIFDGTLSAHHRAVLLPGVHELDPRVIKALEAFAAGGGAVILSDDCKVSIAGATKLGASIDTTFLDTIARLWKENKQDEANRRNTAGNLLTSVQPLADALRTKLGTLGIRPAMGCDNPDVVISRQAGGDVEYLFAVNAAYDSAMGERNSIRPASATLTVTDDGRPIYDALLGRPEPAFEKSAAGRTGSFRFGPGQMRVFARTVEPIGGVRVSTPSIRRDYTVAESPLSLEVAAIVVGTSGRLLGGSIPLQVRVTDPSGAVRYDLFRATDQGTLRLSLPLAVNDPAGQWTVKVKEQLANTEGSATISLANPNACGALAGINPRAIAFGNERDNVYRFFRTWKDITIVKGSSEYHGAAAERIATALKPWGVRCAIVDAAKVNRPREITAEEAPTWVGLVAGKAKPGRDNPINLVGFDLRGPSILLGTPDDNPLIAFLAKEQFLPYAPAKDAFPGRGRGYVAWQRDGIGYDQESIALIAGDAAGMAEAISATIEAAMGQRPLMAFEPPLTSSVTPMYARPPSAVPVLAWLSRMPDRPVGVAILDKQKLFVLSQDGTLALLNERGQDVWRATIDGGGEAWSVAATADGQAVVVGASRRVVAFDSIGGKIFDAELPKGPRPAAATFVAVSADAQRFAAGAGDGSLTLFGPDGKPRWSIGAATDPKAPPNPYLAGAFSADGNALIVATRSELHHVRVADGGIERKLPGVNGAFGVSAEGPTFRVSDAGTSRWYSPAKGQFVNQTSLPLGGLVRVAAAGDDVIVATEADGGVRRITPSAEGKPALVWEFVDPRRVVKTVAFGDGQTAVAYWGGRLIILDAAGKRLAEETLSPEIASVDWDGIRFIVTAADGSVRAMKGR
jgi:hypothetical protein